MNTVTLIYGTDTGMTEEVTHLIKSLWHYSTLNVLEVCHASKQDFEAQEYLILGLSTWYDGDLQSDWETFYEETFKSINFSNKKVAIFGLGDQESYADFFVDGIGILAKTIEQNGGKIIGKWSTDDYEFEHSEAKIAGEDYFYGLALDELNFPEKTEDRVKNWLVQVHQEFNQA